MDHALFRRASYDEGTLVGTPYCDENNSKYIVGLTTTFFALATVCCALRLYSKGFLLKLVGPDDFLMMAAWAMAPGPQVCFYLEVRHGIGQHMLCLDDSVEVPEIKIGYFHGIMVLLGVVLVKLSVAFFMMRLFPYKWWKWLLWILSACLTAFALSCFFTVIFACSPVKADWDLSLEELPTTHCISHDTFTRVGLFNTIFSCITDFLLALCPLPVIAKLKIGLQQKVGLSGVLALGLMASIAGAIKAYYQVNFFSTPDVTFNDRFFVMNFLELTLGIIAANLPCLRPLFLKAHDALKLVICGVRPTTDRCPEMLPTGPTTAGQDGDVEEGEISFMQILGARPLPANPTAEKHGHLSLQEELSSPDGEPPSQPITRSHSKRQSVALPKRSDMTRGPSLRAKAARVEDMSQIRRPSQSIPVATSSDEEQHRPPEAEREPQLATEEPREDRSRFSWIAGALACSTTCGSPTATVSEEILCRPVPADENRHDRRPDQRTSKEPEPPPGTAL